MLRKADRTLVSGMKLVNLQAATLVAAKAQSLAPRGPAKKGHIYLTVKPRATTTKAYLVVGGARQPYPFPLEFGWPSRGNIARPFVYPAIAAMSDEVQDRYWEWFFDVFKEAFPN